MFQAITVCEYDNFLQNSAAFIKIKKIAPDKEISMQDKCKSDKKTLQ